MPHDPLKVKRRVAAEFFSISRVKEDAEQEISSACCLFRPGILLL
jgi:hypothetical protein